MSSIEYINQLIYSIEDAKEDSTVLIDEANYGSTLLHNVLPSLSKRLDLSIVLTFRYFNEKYKVCIPAGTIVNKYIMENRSTNIDKLVDDFNAYLM